MSRIHLAHATLNGWGACNQFCPTADIVSWRVFSLLMHWHLPCGPIRPGRDSLCFHCLVAVNRQREKALGTWKKHPLNTGNEVLGRKRRSR